MKMILPQSREKKIVNRDCKSSYFIENSSMCFSTAKMLQADTRTHKLVANNKRRCQLCDVYYFLSGNIN